mgnify:FL=1
MESAKSRGAGKKLREELARQSIVNNALSKINSKLSEDVEQVIGETLREVALHMDLDRMFLYTFDKDNPKAFSLRSYFDVSGEMPSDDILTLLPERLYLVVDAIKRGNGCCMLDRTNMTQRDVINLMRYNFRAEIAYPIYLEGRLYGILIFAESKSERIWTKEELRFSQSISLLIQNMLDLSKLESGEYQVNARMFNIWETLTGVALAAEQRINDGMIELEGLTMDEKVLVYADPDLIHQVAYNLLDNAIKFTPAGGTIRFSVEKLGPEAEISIWNSGQGISPEALPYVFERFYKEDRSRGLHARGSGLGLNICKVLVNLAGGQIRVESQQGEWCRFVFTLPTCSPNPGGMKRLPDAAGQPGAVEDPASMKPVE